MNIKDRINSLEKKLSGDNEAEARRFTDACLFLGIITPDAYDEALQKAIQNGSNIQDILDALDGRSLGLPSQRSAGLI